MNSSTPAPGDTANLAHRPPAPTPWRRQPGGSWPGPRRGGRCPRRPQTSHQPSLVVHTLDVAMIFCPGRPGGDNTGPRAVEETDRPMDQCWNGTASRQPHRLLTHRSGQDQGLGFDLRLWAVPCSPAGGSDTGVDRIPADASFRAVGADNASTHRPLGPPAPAWGRSPCVASSRFAAVLGGRSRGRRPSGDPLRLTAQYAEYDENAAAREGRQLPRAERIGCCTRLDVAVEPGPECRGQGGSPGAPDGSAAGAVRCPGPHLRRR